MLTKPDVVTIDRYVPGSEKKRQGFKKPRSITITRMFEGKEYKFEIIDNVRNMRSSDWNRLVVAVVSGAAWQFKGFKWKFPVDVFNRGLWCMDTLGSMYGG